MDAAETNSLDGKLVTMIGVAVAALVAVVAGAFVLSFDAITAVSEAAHVDDGLSWLMPVSVDGAMTVGTMAALVLKMLKQSTRYAWFVVLAGVAISVACNALHATQSAGAHVKLTTFQAGAVSAIPAVALALSLHLLILLIEAIGDAVRDRKRTRTEPRTEITADPVRTAPSEPVRAITPTHTTAPHSRRTQPVRAESGTAVRTARTDASEPVRGVRTGVSATPEPARAGDRKPPLVREPEPSKAVKPPKTLVKAPAVAVERDALVAELAWTIRSSGDDWKPDYDDLMARSGYGRSWCEKVVADARKAARASEPPAPRTDEPEPRTDTGTEARTDDPYAGRTEHGEQTRTDENEAAPRTDPVRPPLRAVN
ncbi:DUF2637 domain-containing protein [Nonomuraea rhizosphaerae]|uniref:DUF2637 domain-containing protein n=1 Tax=Nonomuraea rhizosphaerae TaxID=2665663 RepID=UPI001C604872|nr:DUF2637 domain-containing protein [Nonomuraea rhizosphaerae]